MGIATSVNINYFPNQRKVPTYYSTPPTGVWKAAGQVTGDASGGNEEIQVYSDIGLVTKRIITLESLSTRSTGPDLSFFLFVAHLLGTNILDQMGSTYSIVGTADTYGGRPASIIKLPDVISYGYPIQGIVPGTSILLLQMYVPNVLARAIYFSSWGYWWDTSEPDLQR